MTYTLSGKPLAGCTYDELHREWEAGLYRECQVGLSPEDDARLSAVEREMCKKSPDEAGG